MMNKFQSHAFFRFRNSIDDELDAGRQQSQYEHRRVLSQ
jgi:hypothetical protein